MARQITPISPKGGQTAIIDGIEYVYSSKRKVWAKSFSDNGLLVGDSDGNPGTVIHNLKFLENSGKVATHTIKYATGIDKNGNPIVLEFAGGGTAPSIKFFDESYTSSDIVNMRQYSIQDGIGDFGTTLEFTPKFSMQAVDALGEVTGNKKDDTLGTKIIQSAVWSLSSKPDDLNIDPTITDDGTGSAVVEGLSDQYRGNYSFKVDYEIKHVYEESEEIFTGSKFVNITISNGTYASMVSEFEGSSTVFGEDGQTDTKDDVVFNCDIFNGVLSSSHTVDDFSVTQTNGDPIISDYTLVSDIEFKIEVDNINTYTNNNVNFVNNVNIELTSTGNYTGIPDVNISSLNKVYQIHDTFVSFSTDHLNVFNSEVSIFSLENQISDVTLITNQNLDSRDGTQTTDSNYHTGGSANSINLFVNDAEIEEMWNLAGVPDPVGQIYSINWNLFNLGENTYKFEYIDERNPNKVKIEEKSIEVKEYAYLVEGNRVQSFDANLIQDCHKDGGHIKKIDLSALGGTEIYADELAGKGLYLVVPSGLYTNTEINTIINGTPSNNIPVVVGNSDKVSTVELSTGLHTTNYEMIWLGSFGTNATSVEVNW